MNELALALEGLTVKDKGSCDRQVSAMAVIGLGAPEHEWVEMLAQGSTVCINDEMDCWSCSRGHQSIWLVTG